MVYKTGTPQFPLTCYTLATCAARLQCSVVQDEGADRLEAHVRRVLVAPVTGARHGVHAAARCGAQRVELRAR